MLKPRVCCDGEDVGKSGRVGGSGKVGMRELVGMAEVYVGAVGGMGGVAGSVPAGEDVDRRGDGCDVGFTDPKSSISLDRHYHCRYRAIRRACSHPYWAKMEDVLTKSVSLTKRKSA